MQFFFPPLTRWLTVWQTAVQSTWGNRAMFSDVTGDLIGWQFLLCGSHTPQTGENRLGGCCCCWCCHESLYFLRLHQKSAHCQKGRRPFIAGRDQLNTSNHWRESTLTVLTLCVLCAVWFTLLHNFDLLLCSLLRQIWTRVTEISIFHLTPSHSLIKVH